MVPRNINYGSVIRVRYPFFEEIYFVTSIQPLGIDSRDSPIATFYVRCYRLSLFWVPLEPQSHCGIDCGHKTLGIRVKFRYLLANCSSTRAHSSPYIYSVVTRKPPKTTRTGRNSCDASHRRGRPCV